MYLGGRRLSFRYLVLFLLGLLLGVVAGLRLIRCDLVGLVLLVLVSFVLPRCWFVLGIAV